MVPLLVSLLGVVMMVGSFAEGDPFSVPGANEHPISALPWLAEEGGRTVRFGVLGPVTAWDEAGGVVDVKGPRHRAVLARLIVARRRVVPVTRLAGDLWQEEPPPGAVAALRTFVAALRRALEPERPPRAAPRLLVTEGPGYALRAAPDAVDAWRFEQAVTAAAALPPRPALERLEEALGWWRGPSYAEFAGQDWARAERSRLAELRLHAIERRAEALLALGLAGEAVPDLDAHVAENPWREDGWRLLALALYRTGRQGDALAVLRRARGLLAEQLGVDPGPRLRGLEADILRHAPHLDPLSGMAGSVWARAAAAYDRSVPAGARARLESTVTLMRDLAVTGGAGLEAARRHRVAAIAAAEELGEAELTARVIGSYDVPAIWTRSDDAEQAAQVVAAAERALAALPPGAPDAVRARLLATIALESRGMRAAHGGAAARQAEEIARRLDDPALLAFALNGVFMQSFSRAGLAGRRDEVGAELVALSARHGLVTFEVLGHLIRLQARCARADFAGAEEHAAAAERLAERHELPLLSVFTAWYRALRLDVTGSAPAVEEVEAAYRRAAAQLDGAGMPGLERGLLPLASLCTRVRRGLPPGTGEADWGPYEPWVRPLLLAADRRDEAAAALAALPEPPGDLLMEAMWCLVARAAVAVGDREAMRRARAALAPAAGELAGAGSGLLTLGPVSDHLAALADALRDTST
ncbi:AfsR/SARP family transcriptional regulator [Nonomuraea turcica]|uniref:AfsR/SARP family transcriptional regulator n=1 Tax=Nonomuraea sp. G32 TaxID=3067274 RepID=UPI00273B6A60|nr:BTAD domain-containing putative transcriptional regulator [Nonomuraea sp. G32]MDP4503196.1 BTAD domain-containing putative transcriptional regulator [Nonomuraea sp. G32]